MVVELVDRFVFDLGLLAAGREVAIEEYVAPAAAARLRSAMQGARAGGLSIRPDFGEYAQVRIEGDILDTDTMIRAVVDFDDRSVRVDSQGQTVSRMCRRVSLLVLCDADATHIADHRLRLA